jgi:hypothetical protein
MLLVALVLVALGYYKMQSKPADANHVNTLDVDVQYRYIGQVGQFGSNLGQRAHVEIAMQL